MKKTLLILTAILFALTACAPALDEPVSSDEPSTPQTGDFIPSPADSNLTRDVVYLDSVDLLTMESFPLQFALVIKGSLPTPCHEVRMFADQPDIENKIVMDIYSVVDPNTICIQVLEPFEANLPLGSFPTGHYTIWINGEKVTEFDS